MSVAPGAGFPAETITRVAPLGLRLWDVQTDAPPRAGILVMFRRSGCPPLIARRSTAGVHSLTGLPGLGGSERSTGDEPYWANPPVRRTYTIDILDPQGDYLPLRVDADLPHRGVFSPGCPLSGLAPSAVPVFSSPTRPAPSGFQLVRAELQRVSGEPAAWARLDVTLPDGRVVHGLADGAGRLTVLVPVPELAPGAGDLLGQTWTLGVAAQFGVGAARAPVAAAAQAPEICAAIGQIPAQLMADAVQPLTSAVLAYGQTLNLRTQGRSVLLLNT